MFCQCHLKLMSPLVGYQMDGVAVAMFCFQCRHFASSHRCDQMVICVRDFFPCGSPACHWTARSNSYSTTSRHHSASNILWCHFLHFTLSKLYWDSTTINVSRRHGLSTYTVLNQLCCFLNHLFRPVVSYMLRLHGEPSPIVVRILPGCSWLWVLAASQRLPTGNLVDEGKLTRFADLIFQESDYLGVSCVQEVIWNELQDTKSG